jgi:hypothetical protein
MCGRFAITAARFNRIEGTLATAFPEVSPPEGDGGEVRFQPVGDHEGRYLHLGANGQTRD